MVLCHSIVKTNSIVGAATEPKVDRPLAATRRVREYQQPTHSPEYSESPWQWRPDPTAGKASQTLRGYRRDTAGIPPLLSRDSEYRRRGYTRLRTCDH